MIFNSLKTNILVSTTGIVFLSLAATILFLQFRVTEEFSQAFDDNARNLLNLTVSHVETQHSSILYHKAVMLERRKIELNTNITVAFGVIHAAYNQFKKGQISEQAAKRQVIDEFRSLRYADGTGYFWINDTRRPFPRMVMHPTIPELDNTILKNKEFNSALGKNENLFKAMVDVGLADGQGYVDYFWSKPLPGGLTESQSKLSYVKLFRPWGWMIGTGVYIDDIEKDVQDRIDNVIKELNVSLNHQTIRESGYFGIFDKNNRFLVHPFLSGKDGSLLVNPVTGRSVLDEMKTAAAKNTPLDYRWDRPEFESEKHFLKRAFVSYYEPLGWYIFSSVYIDDFQQKSDRLTRNFVLFSIMFLGLTVLISLLVFRGITRPLNSLIQSVTDTDNDGIPLSSGPSRGTREIVALSTTIGAMISTVRESRDALEAQRDFSQGIIDGAPLIIIGMTPSGEITFVNPACERITGYMKTELIGKIWWECFFERKEFNFVQKVLNRTIQGMASDFEIPLICRSGEEKQIVWNGFTRGRQNDMMKIYWFGNDISKRKKAEMDLRYLRNYLLSIINSMPSILIGIDVGGMVTQWNNAAKLFTGISPGEAMGKPLEEVYPLLKTRMEQVRMAMTSRRNIDGIRQKQQKNGAVVHQDVTIYPLLAGNEEGAVIRIDNITEKVRMEETMIQSEKMLSIGGLAAGMAHEINNPLAAVLQTVDVVSSRLLGGAKLSANCKAAEKVGVDLEQVRRYLEIRGIPRMFSNIKEAGKRMSGIVENMLSFARKNGDRKSTHNVTELIEKTLELAVTDYDLKKRYDFKSIEIIREYEENLPMIRCESAKIQQVLLNILRNGAQAMQDVKTPHSLFIIRTLLDDSQKMVQIEIEDNGPGIEEKNRSRIFEPFFTTKPVGIGTGLGLSVSYFIITENHNGDLMVESQPGIGTKFIIRLPL